MQIESKLIIYTLEYCIFNKKEERITLKKDSIIIRQTGVGEIVQMVKYWPYKHKDLSSTPETNMKS